MQLTKPPGALGKLEAGPTVEALESYKPDAIFNVLFGADLSKFVREGNTRGLFKGVAVFNLLAAGLALLGAMGLVFFAVGRHPPEVAPTTTVAFVGASTPTYGP